MDKEPDLMKNYAHVCLWICNIFIKKSVLHQRNSFSNV